MQLRQTHQRTPGCRRCRELEKLNSRHISNDQFKHKLARLHCPFLWSFLNIVRFIIHIHLSWLFCHDVMGCHVMCVYIQCKYCMHSYTMLYWVYVLDIAITSGLPWPGRWLCAAPVLPGARDAAAAATWGIDPGGHCWFEGEHTPWHRRLRKEEREKCKGPTRERKGPTDLRSRSDKPNHETHIWFWNILELHRKRSLFYTFPMTRIQSGV